MDLYAERMDSLDVRELRVFVTVAGAGSFTAAARLLGTSQPSISRTVARLEAAVGVPLVVRTTRHLSLTEAGTVLAREARHALDQVQAAAALARRAARAPGRLTIAVKPDGDAGLLATVLPGFEALVGHPVDLVFTAAGDLAPAVRTGEADACLVAGPVDLTGLDHDLVLSEPRAAVLPRTHRLAGHTGARRADFHDDPVIRWPRLPGELDRFYQGLVGNEPPRAVAAPHASDLAEALRLVELGRGITFLPVGVADRFTGRDIRALPVPDLPPSELHLAWRPTSRDLTLARFIEHLLDAAAREAGDQPAGGHPGTPTVPAPPSRGRSRDEGGGAPCSRASGGDDREVRVRVRVGVGEAAGADAGSAWAVGRKAVRRGPGERAGGRAQ